MTRAKDELDLIVPQRFYTFDCRSWHDRSQGPNRPAKKTGSTTDVAASLLRMWR